MRLQMQQQQAMAQQQQLAMQQQMQAAAAAARNAANKAIPMADQPLQTATGARVRRNKSAGNRKGYANRGARFNVTLNMGGYKGRRGGMPNV